MPSSKRRDDGGAVAILYALTLLLLIGFVALVIDIGALRADNRAAQTTADFASVAAASNLGDGIGGRPDRACEDALRYFRSNTPAVTLSDDNIRIFCEEEVDGDGNLTGGFPDSDIDCYAAEDPDDYEPIVRVVDADTTFTAPSTDSIEPYAVTLTWPVDLDDDDPDLYEADIDGNRCERFSVQVDRTRGFVFANAAGFATEGQTGAPAIARARTGESEEDVASLLILDKAGCIALRATGGTHVELRAHGSTPGRAYVDSLGTGNGCNSGQRSLSATSGGQGGRIEAHASDTHPGEIRLYALESGAVGCEQPREPGGWDCNPSHLEGPDDPSGIWPDPTHLPSRTNRSPADHQFNCKTDYSVLESASSAPHNHDWDVPPCRDTEEREPYIDQLESEIGDALTNPDSSFTVVDGDDCEWSGDDVEEVFEDDNWYLDCDTFEVNQRATVRFQGGNVIIRGGIDVRSRGELYFNDQHGGDCLRPQDPDAPDGNCDEFGEEPAPDACETTVSGGDDPGCWTRSWKDASYVYVANGDIEQRSTEARLEFHRTAVYLRDGEVNIGNGEVAWLSPSAGPFEKLAFWSDRAVSGTPDDNLMGGQGQSEMEGVFFTPNSTTKVSGGAGATPHRAQFFSWRLELVGGGQVLLDPDPETAIPVTTFQGVSLIR